MTTSGTYSFAPPTGDLILSAYGRLGIRRSGVLTEHMLDGQREANFWLIEAANRGPNLWTVDLQSIDLVQGVETYDVDPTTVMMLDVNIETDSSGQSIERSISPLSRTDYSNIPDKAQQAAPTSFWFNRQILPTVSLWPTPDGNGPYVLKFYRFRQMQDANLRNGQNVELPYLFLDAFVAGLAHRLSRYYAPALEAQRKMDSQEAWTVAATQGTEDAPLSISPRLGSYYR